MRNGDPRVPMVAVIGAGRIAEEHLRFLATSQRVRLCAVCDRSAALAEYSADRAGICAAYTDVRRMLEEQQPDVVHVLTPPATHVELIAEALRAKAHVIAEKPVAPSADAFEKLWTMAAECGCMLIEDQNYRFNRPMLDAVAAILDGRIGHVREVDIRMTLRIRQAGGRYADANRVHSSHALPAGIIHEFLPHLCYITLCFFPVETGIDGLECVRAAWRNQGGGELFKYDDLDAIVLSGAAHARIRFSCDTYPEGFAITVRGTRGTLDIDLFHPSLRVSTARGGPAQLTPVINQYLGGRALMGAARRNLVSKVLGRTPYEGLWTFLDRTYESLQRHTAPPVGYADMRRSLELADALLDEANWI